MVRRLSIPEHGAVELLVGVALIAAPLVLDFGPAGLLLSMAAGALVVGLGLSAEMPVSTHMAADTAVAMAMLASALLIAASDAVAAAVLAAAAAGELALGMATRWTRRV